MSDETKPRLSPEQRARLEYRLGEGKYMPCDPDDLRAALAEIDALRAERDQLRRNWETDNQICRAPAVPTDTKPEPTKTAQLRERNAELVKALSEMLERVDYETGDLVKDCWCTSSGNGPPGVDDVVCGACHARAALEASGKAGEPR